MKITKESQGGQEVAVTEEELALIHRLSRKKLAAEEVYTFSVRLCDNEVDRDCERFPRGTLAELAELFVGKSGIFDHDWSAKGQAARIYRTELVEEQGVLTAAGEPYVFLKGYAYMARTEKNLELIAEIEAGIKKEVSVGCAVKRAVCSVCGEDLVDCPHKKGEEYGGRLCYADLLEATDAYEFSFVAVPAQKRAGVIKGKAGRGSALKELVRQNPQCKKQLEALEEEAEAGRRYLSALRREVVRLGGLAEKGLSAGTLEQIAEKLTEAELLEMRKSYEERAMQRYPLRTQLKYSDGSDENAGSDLAFLI